jgi:predicted Zn-dependent protease
MRLVFLIISLWLAQVPATWAAPDVKEGVAISDDETESYLMDMLQLAFSSMNVSIKPQVILISDSSINAAATFGGLVFVNTGLIVECTHAGMLFGVLLHETGHVAGGHLARMDAAIQQAMVPAIASTLIGGAITLATGNPAGLIAGAAGGTQMLERGFKKHTRGEEENADNAALNILGNKSIWMVEMLRMLDRKSGTSIDLYLSTHPLTPDRIATAKEYAERHKDTPCKINFPGDFESRFNLIRKKIIAYTKKVQMLTQEFPESDKSQPNKYGRSIYLYRLGKVDQALSILKDLSNESPESPYFVELVGQIEFEQGKIEDAINNYRKAVDKRPNSPYLKISLSQAYIESKNDKNNENLKLAVQYLTQALDRNPENIFAWRLLARAYGKQNQIPEAAACLAQEAMLTGDFKFAKTKAVQGAKSTNVSLAKKSQDILEQINDDKDLKDKSR